MWSFIRKKAHRRRAGGVRAWKHDEGLMQKNDQILHANWVPKMNDL